MPDFADDTFMNRMELLDTAPIPANGGELKLFRQGDDFSIRISGSRAGGVRRIDRSGHIDRFLADAQERSLFTDRSGRVWVGTPARPRYTGRPGVQVQDDSSTSPTRRRAMAAPLAAACSVMPNTAGRAWASSQLA